MLHKLQKFCESQGGLIAVMAALLVSFSLLGLYTTATFPSNEKAFLMFSNLVTGVSSALFTLARVAGKQDKADDGQKKSGFEDPADQEVK